MYTHDIIYDVDFWRNLKTNTNDWYKLKDNLTANYYDIQIESEILWCKNYLVDDILEFLEEKENIEAIDVIDGRSITLIGDGYENIIQWENEDLHPEMIFNELKRKLNRLSEKIIDMIKYKLE